MKMAVCSPELFLITNSSKIVCGNIMEADEVTGILSEKFVEMLSFFNSESSSSSAIPENARPVNVCGWTTCKLMAMFLCTFRNLFSGPMTNASAKVFKAWRIL